MQISVPKYIWVRVSKRNDLLEQEEVRWKNCINDEKKMSLFIKVEILEILEVGKVEPYRILIIKKINR